jgi:hypothetical protein
MGFVSIFEEEGILRHCVELLASLLSRDRGEINAIDIDKARLPIEDTEEREQERRLAALVLS